MDGFDFDLNVHRSDSKGITSMMIFCFDIMIMELWKNKRPRLNFLVHDSRIFDGIHPRHRYHALRIGQQFSS